MSQYLVITLKHKEKDASVDLLYYSTSVARELSEEGLFPYQDTGATLTSERLSWIVQKVREIIDEKTRQQQRYESEREELRRMVMKTSTKEAVTALLDMLDDNKNFIADTQEEIAFYKSVYQKIDMIQDIYEDNKENGWKVCYTNC